MNKKDIIKLILILSYSILILSYLIFIVGLIWSVITTVLYLVKDVDINSTPIIIFVIGFFGILISYINIFFQDR